MREPECISAQKRDAPIFELSSLDTLFDTAGVEQAFHIYEYDTLCGHLDRDQYCQPIFSIAPRHRIEQDQMLFDWQTNWSNPHGLSGD
jgi:hypothetical protein